MSKQPTDAEYAEPLAGAGGRRPTVRRTQGLLALTASLAVVAAGLVGMNQLLSDDAPSSSSDPGSNAAAPSATLDGGPLDVSGTGVGDHRFGADADEVIAVVAARFGKADVTVGPQQYARIPGHDGWFEDAGDPISPSWEYPVTSVSCWGVLCLIFGGDEADTLRLRGWELSSYRLESGSEESGGPQRPDVRLAETGIRLGDSWKALRAAYPGSVIGGAEGASVAVQNIPWPGVSDGAAAWRLSGQWDYARPTRAPAGAVVTRLSGGEGPEPGCC